MKPPNDARIGFAEPLEESAMKALNVGQGIPPQEIVIFSPQDFYSEMQNKNLVVTRPIRIRAKKNLVVAWPGRLCRKQILW